MGLESNKSRRTRRWQTSQQTSEGEEEEEEEEKGLLFYMQLGIIRVNEGKQSVHGVLLGEREREREREQSAVITGMAV